MIKKKELFFQEYPNLNKPYLFILHGLMGSGDNWRYLAKQFQKHFYVICPDLRNHGNSFHHQSMTYEEMAEDIQHLIQLFTNQTVYIIGHSMGGKVAMTSMQLSPHLFKKSCIVDIAPKQYNHHHTHIFKAIQETDLTMAKTRTDILNQISNTISDEATRQLLLKNIGRNKKNQFCWKPNVNIIEQYYPHIMTTNLTSKQINIPTLFLKGEQSPYIQKKDISLIQNLFETVTIHNIKNAGHWLQADQPEDVLNNILLFFN